MFIIRELIMMEFNLLQWMSACFLNGAEAWKLFSYFSCMESRVYEKKIHLTSKEQWIWEFEDIKPVEGELNMLSNSFVPKLLHL